MTPTRIVPSWNMQALQLKAFDHQSAEELAGLATEAPVSTHHHHSFLSSRAKRRRMARLRCEGASASSRPADPPAHPAHGDGPYINMSYRTRIRRWQQGIHRVVASGIGQWHQAVASGSGIGQQPSCSGRARWLHHEGASCAATRDCIGYGQWHRAVVGPWHRAVASCSGMAQWHGRGGTVLWHRAVASGGAMGSCSPMP